MTDVQIAEVLTLLYRDQDPSQAAWGFGSVEYWKDPDDEKIRTGKSFYDFWRRSVEEDGDAQFKCRILPLLPDAWRQNYALIEYQPCPFHWAKMSDDEIAKVLQELHKSRDPEIFSWGFGSISLWTGEHAEPWGQSFFKYWRRKFESAGKDDEFKKRIHPKLPPAWRKKYLFRIVSRPHATESGVTSEACL